MAALAITITFIGFFGCTKDDSASPTNNGKDTTTVKGYAALNSAPDTVTFAKHIQPLLTANCALSGCHAGASPQNGLTLEAGKSYASLKGKSLIETPTDAQNTGLFIKLTYPTAAVMPPTGKLSQDKLNRFYQWLQKGAKNN